MAARKLVVDAHPLIALLRGEPDGGVVRGLITDAYRDEAELLLSVVNVTEVMYVLERHGGPEASHATLDLLQQLPFDLVPVDLELAARAAWLRAGGGLSLGDAFAAALAHREGVPVLTGDPEFERVADRVEVIWLDR